MTSPSSSPRFHWKRLHDLVLRHDTRDVLIVLAYTAFTGTLALVVPLTVQALVNTIVAGVFLQPLVILTGLLLAVLLMRGILRLFKLYLVETLQERLFARVALEVAGFIPRVQHPAVTRAYMPAMTDRFFDVITLQKGWAKILLEGPSTVIAIVMGSLLLAVYSPYLIAFDLALLASIFAVILLLGIGGPVSSIKESKQKYRLAAWLEELGRCHQTFRKMALPTYSELRADEIVCDYVKARRSHFRVLFRQAIGNYLLQALATAGVLGIGGWLVVERRMSIGQLVAAELVVYSMMSSVEKLIRMCEDVFDMLAGADKIGALLDLPVEPEDPVLRCPGRAAHIIARDMSFSYQTDRSLFEGASLHVPAGSLACLMGPSGSGKSTLALLIAGHLTPQRGRVRGELPDHPDTGPRIEPLSVVVDSRRDLFEGSIEENLLLGRTPTDPDWFEKIVDLTGLSAQMRGQQGLATSVESEGWNLPGGMATRIKLARALVDRPSILILDDAMIGLASREKVELIGILQDLGTLTILCIEHDPAVILRSSLVLLIEKGGVHELGPGSHATSTGRLAPFIGPLHSVPRPPDPPTGGRSERSRRRSRKEKA